MVATSASGLAKSPPRSQHMDKRQPSVLLVLLLAFLLAGTWQLSINLSATLHRCVTHVCHEDMAQPSSAVSAQESDVVLGITHHKTGELKAN